jgi:hypothetical protein
VARCLEEMGHEVVVADPNFAPMYATRSRRVKTDKRDARTLAEACKLGAYKPAHRTSDGRRHLRAQLAVREALVLTRTRYISLMRALVRREGFQVGSGSAEAFAQRLEAMQLPEHLKDEVAPLLCVMEVETILVKRGISIAASAIGTSLRAAGGSSHFKRFARRDGGWGAQSPSLWAPIRANFLIQAPTTRARAFPRSRRSKSRASRRSFPVKAEVLPEDDDNEDAGA